MSIFHPRRNMITSSYKIHDHFLSSVEHYKYLGITIQCNLKWHNYIQLITSKANETLALLKCNLRTPSIQLRERAYLGLVRPKLEYAATVWSPYLINDKNTLEEVQRSAARYVKGIYSYDASVTQMHNELQWESIESLRDQSCLIMLYNILKQNIYLPSKYIHEFHSQISQYQLQTRFCHMLRLAETFCNTDIYKYSFVPSSSRLWNSLSRHMIESTSNESFKSILRDYYRIS